MLQTVLVLYKLQYVLSLLNGVGPELVAPEVPDAPEDVPEVPDLPLPSSGLLEKEKRLCPLPDSAPAL